MTDTLYESDTQAAAPAPAPIPPQVGAAAPGAPDADDQLPIISPQDDGVDFGTLKPVRVTAAMLNQKAHQLANPVFNLYLHQTTINMGLTERFYAKVRIVNLADRALVGTLPDDVRELIERLFFRGEQRRPAGFSGKQRMETGLSRSEQIARAYGCAGFISPRLMLHESDVRDPENETWVGNIALHDLQEFMRICEGDDQLAARRLEQFSE